MQWMTFNKLYAAMLTVALISVLVAPKTVSDRARAQARGREPMTTKMGKAAASALAAGLALAAACSKPDKPVAQDAALRGFISDGKGA